MFYKFITNLAPVRELEKVRFDRKYLSAINRILAYSFNGHLFFSGLLRGQVIEPVYCPGAIREIYPDIDRADPFNAAGIS